MAHVKLILREDVSNLGDAGELVTVRPGYARNFLLPYGKAILATEASIKELEHHKKVVADRLARERKAQLAERDRIQNLSLEISVQAGEEGKLFGSVTSMDIAEAAAARGVTIDKRKIVLEEPIKRLGDFAVPVKLHADVVVELKVMVVAEE